MDVKILVTSFGSFVVHRTDCEFIDRDIKTYGVTQEYDGEDITSANEIAEAMQQAEAPHQTLQIVKKRVSCHYCVGPELKDTGIKWEIFKGKPKITLIEE